MATDLFGEAERDAVLSADGRYRYLLRRRWSEWAPVLWVMLNPSTADANVDDPTIRRCVRFARDWRCGGIAVVNLFALRSSDPDALRSAADPVGPDNDAAISRAHLGCWRVVVAWGAHGAYQGRDTAVLKLLQEFGVEPFCLGLTAGGQPKHPLYVPARTRLVPFGD